MNTFEWNKKDSCISHGSRIYGVYECRDMVSGSQVDMSVVVEFHDDGTIDYVGYQFGANSGYEDEDWRRNVEMGILIYETEGGAK